MNNVIHYPQRESEFEVQADLWCELKIRGYNIRGCVPAHVTDGDDDVRCFLDIVVFDRDKSPICIIEVKNHVEIKRRKIGSRQARRYGLFNVPIVLCLNSYEIPRALEEVDLLVNAHPVEM